MIFYNETTDELKLLVGVFNNHLLLSTHWLFDDPAITKIDDNTGDWVFVGFF